MTPVLPAALLMALALCGCSRDPGPPVTATDPAPAASPGIDPSAVIDPTPATDPVPAPAPVDPAQMAKFTGYGDMQLGSTAAEAVAAWGGELEGRASEAGGCHYLTPKWVKDSGELGFMIEGDRFVRYDVGTAKETAPGGGKVGMDADALQAMYSGALQSMPHKYEQGGRYLSVAAGGVAPTRLVFEVDAAGKVTEWRVGLSPQVDYVEGCS